MIRAKKRADFEKHRHIQDLNVIDLLLFKSHQEYQETMNCWKQEVSLEGDGWSGIGCGL
jgi:NADH dehydrogenase (ubiquinone) 1 alpha subcomplex subunit 6